MKKNLLVLNKAADSGDVQAAALKNERYGVYFAHDSNGAFDILLKKQIHLVLLNLSLSRGKDTRNCLTICRKIRAEEKFRNIPIIAVLASQSEENVVTAIEYGANDFVTVPFSSRILIAKIRSLLTLKEEEDRLRQNREKLLNLINTAATQKEMLSQEAEFSQDLNRFLDAELKKAFIRERLSAFLGARLFTIFTLDESEREFRLFVSNHSDIPQNLMVPVGKNSIMYEALKRKHYIFLKDYSKSRFHKSGREKYLSNVACCVPLISGERTIGVLNVNDPASSNMDNYDFEGRIVRISRHLAVSIHNTILYEKVKDLSMRDSMTGLYNFRYFVETLRSEVDRALRYDEPLTCIMLDVDNFKTVNDVYGHQAGDLVLKELARSVSLSVRSSDIPARYGGDEFIIVCPNTGKSLALKIAGRLMKLFSKKAIRIPTKNKTVKVTLSVGIAGIPDDTTNMDELMKLADEALYRAKHEGKNRIITI